ncbi:MAG: hypothetical protein RIT81_40455 [Deltaproteobacteria bacterium]
MTGIEGPRDLRRGASGVADVSGPDRIGGAREDRADVEIPLSPTSSYIAASSPEATDLGWIEDWAARSAQITDAELTALRGLVLELSKQELQALRPRIQKRLGRERLEALKGTGVLRGTATVDKVMQMIGGPGRLGRLPARLKTSIRTAREQNIHALMQRAALRLVNGNDGLFRTVNLGDRNHPEGFPVAVRGERIDSVAQRYALLDGVARLVRVGFSEEEIRALANDAVDTAVPADASPAERAQLGVNAILDRGQEAYAKRARKFEDIPAPTPMSTAQREQIAERLSQARWLESKVLAAFEDSPVRPLGDYTEDLTALFDHATFEDVAESLDARFETVLTFGVERGLRIDFVPKLDTVKFERIAAERGGPVRDVSDQRLPDDHAVRFQLDDLRRRLDAGDRSAVGVAYCTQTFPMEILERAAAGEVHVVGYDGSHTNGVDYIRSRHGVTEDGARLGARVMGLQGVYGSFSRSLVTLDDGQQFLLVTGYGVSRQLNNVATLLLYEDDEGRRLPASQISLATDHSDLTATLRADIQLAIHTDWDQREGRPDAMPTRLMILQNPPHLEQLLQDDLRWGATPDNPMLPFFVAYRTHEDGTEERIIVPKVGGGGVYGDTAGHFIEAFFTSGFDNLVDDVLFNGAAGGFAGTREDDAFVDEDRRGLPHVEPGGLIEPTYAVEQYGDGRGPITIPGMLPADVAQWPDELVDAAKDAHVSFTGRHVAVMAPAIETFGMIHDLVGRGFASVDVEAGAVMDTCRRLGKTATVVYTHSDDPRASELEPTTALGMVAPFFEGSHYDGKLFGFLKALWDHSHATRGAK